MVVVVLIVFYDPNREKALVEYLIGEDKGEFWEEKLRKGEWRRNFLKMRLGTKRDYTKDLQRKFEECHFNEIQRLNCWYNIITEQVNSAVSV